MLTSQRAVSRMGGGGLGGMLSSLGKVGFFWRVSSGGWSVCQVTPDVLAHPQETCERG